MTLRPTKIAAFLLLGALTACRGGGVASGHHATAEMVRDFTATVHYVDDSGAVFGTRWVHDGNGMPVTVLHIQSVPQVFLYVNTPPVSDRGEPHTGEHLLLGKGRRGKTLAASEEMSLIGSTAYTSQSDVVYAWNCSAGKDTFYRSVGNYLEALLLPDYTDEEVRREVCNVGVSVDAKTGALSLEEKGTIYNEMVSAYERRWNVFRSVQQRLWGADHPNGYSSGGEPSAVRAMEPHHIHEFHRDHYQLSANLGMIVALPNDIAESEFLEHLAATVAELDARPELASREKKTFTIPPARPEPDRSVRIVPFPNANENDAGVALIAWPPVATGSLEDRILAQTLMSTLASGATSSLYKRLMDSATREVDVDASEMFGFLETTKVDAAPMIGFDGYQKAKTDDATVAKLLHVIADEITRVASLAPGSAELAAFNEKALFQLTEWHKQLRKQLDAPPLFGHRSSGGFWLDHLRLLDLLGDEVTTRPVTLGPEFEELRARLSGGENPWTGVVARLHLSETPYVSIAVPSPDELALERKQKEERIAGYTAEYRERYHAPDAHSAIAAYKQDYDAASAELAALEQGLPQPHLVDDVPLTADPAMILEPLAGLPGYRGVFDNIGSVETSLALDLHGVDPGDLPWLAILPQFLTSAGVVVDGKPVAYDEAERLRSEEIYGLSAEYATRPSVDRHELRLNASGLDLDEAGRAITWLAHSLFDPWIAPENLPRLRDLVAQTIRDRRGQLGGREESWVRNPANALRFQDDALYLADTSLHSQLFALARLEWLLTAPPAEDGETSRLLTGLAHFDAASVGDGLAAVAKRLESSGAPDADTARAVAARVKELVSDMAPGSVREDLAMLARVIRSDLAVPPAEALARFDRVRRTLLSSKGRARFVLTGSRVNTTALMPRLNELYARLGDAESATDLGYTIARGCVRERMDDHEELHREPVHHALVYGGGRSGVFVLSARAAGLDDLDAHSLISELASRVYGGSGAHGFFMQTWGAGLAYSNGLGVTPQGERVSYYAERCPDLVETMKFVVGLAKGADALDDAYLAEYTIAAAVGYSRASDGYESRTRAAADEMVDGDTPERIANWRRAVLALRARDDLWAQMKPLIVSMTGRVLPGLGPNSRDVDDGSFLVIAPAPLIEKWEGWVHEHEGADEHVFRIYPRDFWLVPGDTGAEMRPSAQ